MAAVNRMTMTSRHRHGGEEENCARGAACRTWRAARWDGTGCPGTDSSRPLISPNIYLEHLHLQSATNGSTQCARMELTAVTRCQEVVMLVLAVILNVVDFVLFLDARACHGAWAAPYLAMAQVILVYWLVEELMKRGTVLRSDPGSPRMDGSGPDRRWLVPGGQAPGDPTTVRGNPRDDRGVGPHGCSHRSRWEAKEIRWTMSCGTRAAAHAAARRPQPRRLRRAPMIRQTR